MTQKRKRLKVAVCLVNGDEPRGKIRWLRKNSADVSRSRRVLDPEITLALSRNSIVSGLLAAENVTSLADAEALLVELGPVVVGLLDISGDIL